MEKRPDEKGIGGKHVHKEAQWCWRLGTNARKTRGLGPRRQARTGVPLVREGRPKNGKARRKEAETSLPKDGRNKKGMGC